MADELSQADRALTIKTPLGNDKFVAISLTGTEGISRPFQFLVDMVSEDQAIEFDKILGKSATFNAKLDDDYERNFNGIVWRFTQGAVSNIEDSILRNYQAELVPWTYFLKLNSNSRIFQEKTPPEIVEQVFKDNGLTDYKLSLKGTYAKQDYCVQYNETDYDFVSRMLEQYGIYYYFNHEDSKHTLVLGDAASAYVDLTKSEVDYSGDFSDPIIGEIDSWSRRYECITGKVELRDYDYVNPSTALIAKEKTIVKLKSTASMEQYEYAGGFLKAADGKALATVRMEAQEAMHDVATGSGNHPGFQAGGKFKLKSHPVKAEVNAKYVLTSVEHRAQEPIIFSSGPIIGAGEKDMPIYWNKFECVPSKVAFRPARVTPKPHVAGPQSAVVVGPKAQEIFTNKFGEVKVQFHWDREGKMDDKSSCWIRVAQSWAGGKYGAQFMPRVGNEVIVEYLDGDIDRPIITGSVYNGDNSTIYALPDEQNKSGFKTLSTDKAKAKNFNELRFDDTIGKEEVYFHAERDFNRVVENNDTLKVGFDAKDKGDQKIDIYNNRTVTIDKGDDTLTLTTGSRTVEIKADDALTVKTGNHTIDIKAGESSITAAKAITLKVGGSMIKIDMQGVTIKGPQILIQADAQADLKSPMTTVSGDGMLTLKGGMVKIN
ncbi:type VI secretion system tip protein TssI/VgrG [uncultured Rubinisphaera sp.]|uniref:type VI secretion system Vgr family protein n=1 Tax=uncultured Rubinisphaera sp. TaxID=1678686 RepID=UPI0030DD4B40